MNFDLQMSVWYQKLTHCYLNNGISVFIIWKVVLTTPQQKLDLKSTFNIFGLTTLSLVTFHGWRGHEVTSTVTSQLLLKFLGWNLLGFPGCPGLPPKDIR